MEFSLRQHLTTLEVVADDLQRRNVVNRIWQKDYTLWKPDPTEITNRLGWLTVIDLMRAQAPALKAFAHEVRDDGFRQVVLLGMGGSSLGPEVMGKTFSNAEGYPELIVLDSTLPANVQAITDAIEPARTLFLVSSKSGATIETICLLQHFKSLVMSAIGKGKAGKNFVAVTDPGTPLARLAVEEQFRRNFLNPSDIGGRYSVLSFFGLVPAALIGIDITVLLERADRLRARCASSQPVHENPGAQLGAVLSVLALQKRDKLTLVTSPGVSSFGLWVEQLTAESTGKDGKGIVPVVDEPLMEPHCYGDDRFFVYLRLRGDNNLSTDDGIGQLKSSGQPVIILELRDKHDLGAEFFRWEFATAVAGAILGIHPFDQPNVELSKQVTDRLLQYYINSGRLPETEVTDSLAGLLAKADNGTYLSVLAYLKQTPQVDRVMADFRCEVAKKYRIATMIGYGPRYLHSTGQLHKGGPGVGLFLEITAGHEEDLPIPGKPYTFGVLADAQALGDYQSLQQLGRSIAWSYLANFDVATLSKLLSRLV